MEIPVLIEPLENKRFRARGGEPFACTAEGDTRDEALQNLRDEISKRIPAGAEIVGLKVPSHENPWLACLGVYKDDPLFDEWQQAIADNRREMDADPNVP